MRNKYFVATLFFSLIIFLSPLSLVYGEDTSQKTDKTDSKSSGIGFMDVLNAASFAMNPVRSLKWLLFDAMPGVQDAKQAVTKGITEGAVKVLTPGSASEPSEQVPAQPVSQGQAGVPVYREVQTDQTNSSGPSVPAESSPSDSASPEIRTEDSRSQADTNLASPPALVQQEIQEEPLSSWHDFRDNNLYSNTNTDQRDSLQLAGELTQPEVLTVNPYNSESDWIFPTKDVFQPTQPTQDADIRYWAENTDYNVINSNDFYYQIPSTSDDSEQST